MPSNTHDFPTLLQTKSGEFIYIFYGYFSPFSTIHTSPFILDGDRFYTAEQNYLYRKANYFGDMDIATRILATIKLKEQRALANRIKNFNHAEWMRVCDLVSIYKK